MGFFDFFKRKPKQESDLDFSLDELQQPQCHHYTLAHYALRGVAFQQPLGFFGILASPDATGFLSEMLESVTEHCHEREPQPSFSVADIAVHQVRVAGRPGVVIEMPEPHGATEAYFVAALLLTEVPAEDESDPQNIAIRYFTLEKGVTLGGPARTVLCEWTADGTHLNYGTGPKPTVQAFVRKMEEMLARQ